MPRMSRTNLELELLLEELEELEELELLELLLEELELLELRKKVTFTCNVKNVFL